MSAVAWLTEAEFAERLHITIRTLKQRLAEANIRGVRPGRSRLFSEADFQTLLSYLDQRATSLTPRTAPVVPVNVRRAVARSDTRRLLQRVKRLVTSLEMEKGGHK